MPLRPRPPLLRFVGSAGGAAVGVLVVGALLFAAGPRGASPVPAGACGVTGAPGTPRVDDPYLPALGNGGYDVRSYRIDNTVDTAGARLVRGTSTIAATATQDLSAFSLDLALVPDAVRVDGRPARFRRVGAKLSITPRCAVREGAPFTVVVGYHSGPRPRGWFHATDEILVSGEPDASRWWFPVNATLRDSALYDVTLRVPRGRQGISVGRLIDTREQGGLRVWRWRTDEPLGPYQAFMAAGRFEMASQRVGGVDFTYAVSRALPARSRRINMRLLQLTPGILALQATEYGRYPFSAGGGLVTATFDTEDWAMENQTRPTYPAMADDAAARRLMVHELAHQWMGDLVRLDQWSDIVDNEGMARWAEMLWTERHGGPSAARQMATMWTAHGPDDPFWGLRLDDPGKGRLFDPAVYDRGGMMQQALRNRIGDAAYRRLLRAWVERFTGRTARVDDFEALAAQVSGQDLSGFFTAWLRTPARPAWTPENGFPESRP